MLFFPLLLLFLLLLTLPAAAMTVEVVDDLQVIDDSNAFCRDVDSGNTGDVRFCLLTVQQTSNRVVSESTVADRFNIKQGDDAVALVIRAVGRSSDFYYDMYTFGDAYGMFAARDIDRILDDDAVWGNIKGGAGLSAGATRFFTLAAEQVTAHYESERAREARAVPMAILVGAVAGLLAGGGAVLAVFLYYRRRQHGESYPLDRYAKLELTAKTDRFVGSFVTRTRVKSSSSSGGGGGGGGSHRGGR